MKNGPRTRFVVCAALVALATPSAAVASDVLESPSTGNAPVRLDAQPGELDGWSSLLMVVPARGLDAGAAALSRALDVRNASLGLGPPPSLLGVSASPERARLPSGRLARQPPLVPCREGTMLQGTGDAPSALASLLSLPTLGGACGPFPLAGAFDFSDSGAKARVRRPEPAPGR